MEIGGRRLTPELNSRDVCIKCVEDIFSGDSPLFRTRFMCANSAHFFLERLYALEHPGKVEEFDQLNEMDGSGGSVFISRPWLKGNWLETH